MSDGNSPLTPAYIKGFLDQLSDLMDGLEAANLTIDSIQLILAERHRQDEKWGKQRHTPRIWALILLEEIGEVGKAILEDHKSDDSPYYEDLSDDPYLTELIHLAAVALAAIESHLDRKEPPF